MTQTPENAGIRSYKKHTGHHHHHHHHHHLSVFQSRCETYQDGRHCIALLDKALAGNDLYLGNFLGVWRSCLQHLNLLVHVGRVQPPTLVLNLAAVQDSLQGAGERWKDWLG